MPRSKSRSIAVLLAATAALVGAKSTLASFTSGNLVVTEVTGSGVGNLNDPVQLQEYNLAGSTVGSAIPLMTTGGTPLVLPDTPDHDGQLTLSVNGNVLTTAAYLDIVNPINGLAANVDTPANAPRVITVVRPDGSLDTSTQLSGSNDYSGVSIRQVTSIDGTQFWTSGNGLKPYGGTMTLDAGGLRYSTLGASTSTSLNPNFGVDVRSTTIFAGQLYGATGSSNNPTGQHTTFMIGSGTPSLGAQTFTALIKTGTSPPTDITGNQSPEFDTLANGNVVLYTSDSTDSGLDKYLYVSATNTWTAEGTISLAGIEDIASTVTGNTVNLYVSTASEIYSFSDTTTGTSITGDHFSNFAPASSGDAFRGIAFAPTPEPATAGLLLVGGAGLLRSRRRANG